MTAALRKTENTADDAYEQLLLQHLDHFLEYAFHYAPVIRRRGETPARKFGIAGDVPEVFNEMIDRLVTLYNDELDTASAIEFLNLAESDGSVSGTLFRMEWMLHDPFSEFSSPEVPRVNDDFDRKAPAWYTLHAVMRFNHMLPALQEGGIEALELEELLLFQRALEHAKAATLCSAYLQHYQNHIPPNRQLEQSRAGGKARAEKLYGKAKTYAAARFAEIRDKGSDLNMSQIAQKIAYELEQNPVEDGEPLSNPYDTIYRWVRALNRRQ